MVNITAMANKTQTTKRRRRVWSRFVRVLAMVVVFCTTYALILPAITMEKSAVCGLEEHTHSEACYATSEWECIEPEVEAHKHSDPECYTYEKQLICEQEEGEAHEHGDACYDLVGTLTCQLPETEGHNHELDDPAPASVMECTLQEHTHSYACYPAESREYTYSDETVQVSVILPKDTTVPADAVLKVTAIESDAEGYDALVEQAEDTVDGEVKNIALYDISFYTAEEDYIPVEDSAQVSLRFVESLVGPASDVVVLHYDDEDSNPQILEEVTVAEQPTEETTLSAISETQTVLTFQTEGFSTFAVVEVGGFVTTEIYDSAKDVTENRSNLDGKTVVITMGFEDGGRYSLSSEDVKIHEWYELNGVEDYYEHDRLKGIPAKRTGHTITNPTADSSLLWKFEAVEGEENTYYVQSVSTGRYLLIDANRTVKTTDGYTDANKIHIVPDTAYTENRVEIYGNNNQYLYFKNTTNQEQLPAFGSWGQSSVNNTKFILSEYTDDSKTDPPAVTEPVTGTGVDSLAGKVYVMAGVNFDTQNSADDAVIVRSTALDGEGRLTGGNAPDDLTLDANGNATALKIDGENNTGNSLWVFEPAANGRYYVRSLTTGQYLRTNSANDGTLAFDAPDGENAKKDDLHAFVVGDAQNPTNVKNAKVLYHNIAGRGDYYLALNNNNINGDFIAKTGTNAADLATHLVLIEQGYSLVTNLGGKSYIISGVNNNEIDNLAVLMSTPKDENHLNATNITKANYTTNAAGNAVESVSLEDTTNAVWTFEEVADKPGSYYIKDNASGQYLNITDGKAFLGEKQLIEARVSDQTQGYIKFNTNVVSLRSPDGSFLILDNNTIANGFNGIKNDDYQKNRGTHLVLTEVDPVAQPSGDTPVTGLGDKVYFVVGVDNNENNDLPALSSTAAEGNGLIGQNINANIIKSGHVENIATVDDGNDLGWAFKETNTPGVYNIMAVNGANGVDLNNHLIAEAETTCKYLRINADGTLTVSNEKQDIQVVKGTTGASDVDTVALRTEINGVYHYVALKDNSRIENFFSETDVDETDDQTHLALVEMKSVNNVVDLVNKLLFGDGDYYTEADNMEFVADENYNYTDENGVEHKFYGSFKFGDDKGDIALTGTATNKNGTDNQGGGGSEASRNDPNTNNFKTNYDNAVAYREKQQELAKAAKAAYDALPEEEKKYVYNAEELLALKWLWTELETVAPAAPLATVKLFNYSDGTVDGQPDVNSGTLSDKYGFNFYHKIQYNVYTAENVQSRDNSGKFGCNDTGLTFAPTLNDSGVPVVTSGWNNNGGMQPVAEGEGSLGYLFSQDESPYYVTSMEQGGGLFQYDARTGYYYYNANQNAAHWDEKTNKFVLYDAVIRPMYVPAGENGTTVGATNNEDRYNFLPFDDPANTAIVDPNTMHITWESASGETLEWDKTSAYLNERPDVWFGMTIDTNFFMPRDGQVLDPQGKYQDMIFRFHGDDDTLVYINGVLVIDIGGVHGAEDGWINFATGEVFYQDRPNGNYESGTKKEVRENIQKLMIDNFRATDQYKNSTDDQILKVLKDDYGIEFEAGINGELTLKQYTTYTMDFFYMERGGNVSYCGIEYNLVEIPSNSLSITKEVDADTDNDGIDDVIDTNLTYTFRVMKANAATGEVLDENYFPVHTPYTIYEAGNAVGTGYVDDNGYITLREGQRAEFTNITDPYKGQTNIPDYVVQEILPDGQVGQYHVWYTCVGTKMELVNNPITGKIEAHTIYQTKPIRVGDPETQFVTFTNEVKEPVGSLAIQKKLVDDTTSDLEFTFRIETGGISAASAIAAQKAGVSAAAEYFKIERGTLYKLYTVEADGALTEITGTKEVVDKNGVKHYYHEVTSDDGTIKLKQNQRAVFEGILAGTHFKITEVLKSGQNFAATYEGEILDVDNSNNGTTTVYYDASGVYGSFALDGADVLATVTNDVSLTKVTLPIKKTVSNWFGTDSFEFDTKRITKIAFPGGIPSFGEEDLEDVANPNVTIKGVEDKTSVGETEVVFNFKLDDVEGITTGSKQFYYRVTEKEDNNKSFIYDKSVYVVEVTLKQNGDEWTGDVTRVWEDSDGDGPLGYSLVDGNGEEAGTPAPESVDFENYRYTSMSVQKFVSGVVTDDSFTFEATVYADFIGGEDGYTEGNHLPFDLRLIPQNTADGSGLTIKGENHNIAEFSITHGKTQIIHVPYGASITVKETGGTGYITTYRVGSGGLTQGNETGEFTADGEIHVVFNNEKSTSVTIEKKFDGDSNKVFNFTATITSPTGTERKVDFNLQKDGKYVIDGIQFGSTIKVEETNGSGYLTTYHTETKIEAESGSSTGSVNYQREASASGGILLGNINGDTSTVTLSPEFYTAGAYNLMLHYNQNATRSFVVNVNDTSGTYAGETTGDWGKSFKDLTIESAAIVNGKNSIKIGGTVNEDGTGNYAPNLDFVKLTSAETDMTSTHAMTEYINGEMTIVVTNEIGYELPESGGAGTFLYILGGLFMMAAPVVYGFSKRFRRERRVSA